MCIIINAILYRTLGCVLSALSFVTHTEKEEMDLFRSSTWSYVKAKLLFLNKIHFHSVSSETLSICE